MAAAVVEVGVILAAIRYSPGHGLIPSIVFLTGIVAAGLFIGTTLRARRAYLAALVERAARLEHERDQQARLAATAERTRIAREMHDIVAHSLSVVISLADGAALTNRSHPDQATAAMEQVSAVGRQALSETRRLLGVLRDDHDPADLAPQPGLDRLDDLLARVRDAGLPTRLVVTGQPVRLAATEQTAVYRIVQEALTNVIKHARHVTDVQVRLDWSAEGLDVEISDDGVGAR